MDQNLFSETEYNRSLIRKIRYAKKNAKFTNAQKMNLPSELHPQPFEQLHIHRNAKPRQQTPPTKIIM